MSEPIAAQFADSIPQVVAMIRSAKHITIRGFGTKPALAATIRQSHAQALDLSRLSGIIEYEPQEYTFTALAGTKVSDVRAMLQANNQYLPFDPVLVNAGATLGGTLASGLSGSGRLRYGGLRDFVLGVRFVDGQGTLVKGGGKVVKNAAGFDFPKLMVGSCGRLGVVVEASFKVFPAPQSCATLLAPFAGIHPALETLYTLTGKPIDLIALDLLQRGDSGAWMLAARIGGDAALLAERLLALRRIVGAGDALQDEADTAFWSDAAEFSWAEGKAALVKAPVTPSLIPDLEATLSSHDAPRRYAVAGNLLWLSWAEPLSALSAILNAYGLCGTVVRGAASSPWIGHMPVSAFAQRLKSALDPNGKFPPLFTE